MTAINWNDGRLIDMGQGDTATCTGGLNQGQLYGLFFYNSAGHQASTTVTVVYSNSQPPVQVVVPGTTAKQGLAAVCFVDGDDTNTVSAAILQGNQGAQIQAFMCSVKMPVNTAGINNAALPADGKPHAFTKFTRWYDVPATHWYQAQLQSDIDQFISVQFREQAAEVYIVNQVANPMPVISYAGGAKQYVKVTESTHQSASWFLQGDGTQWVWMNADSAQNSKNTTITLQSLSGLYGADFGRPRADVLEAPASDAHFAAEAETKQIARATLAAAKANNSKITLFSAFGVSLVLTYGLSTKGLHASLDLDTPVGDISLGNVTLDASHPSVKLGGSIAGFTAQVTLDYDVAKSDLTACYAIGIPFVGTKKGCKTIHV